MAAAYRRAIQTVSRDCVLLCVRSAGIVVRTVGRPMPTPEAPILVAAPHSSFFDTVAAMHGCPVPSAVVRSKSKGMFFLSSTSASLSLLSHTVVGLLSLPGRSEPLTGHVWALAVCPAAILNFTQPVYVKRSDPNSRQNTVREIIRRATSKDPWSQVIIFPEGTCTNRTCLISFKLGAFVPGVPVQPVLIRYPNELNTLIWTWDGPSALQTLWLTLCQLKTHMEIEIATDASWNPTTDIAAVAAVTSYRQGHKRGVQARGDTINQNDQIAVHPSMGSQLTGRDSYGH
ncbi:hypothetical protein HPB48_003724 [Haemaphysalis longicornis]|uniref:Phospholipid/glycerol acyltransferase domain-containing protein n=1 Tax=Haemaphysalis longicornis TaxID=44386 RepID=A0A9J6FFU2_HAELO|nr:hypothetical protein HPB48_003724 [Haemaphysalis longicornis]